MVYHRQQIWVLRSSATQILSVVSQETGCVKAGANWVCQRSAANAPQLSEALVLFGIETSRPGSVKNAKMKFIPCAGSAQDMSSGTAEGSRTTDRTQVFRRRERLPMIQCR